MKIIYYDLLLIHILNLCKSSNQRRNFGSWLQLRIGLRHRMKVCCLRPQ